MKYTGLLVLVFALLLPFGPARGEEETACREAAATGSLPASKEKRVVVIVTLTVCSVLRSGGGYFFDQPHRQSERAG
jgi:hypothetical protein